MVIYALNFILACVALAAPPVPGSPQSGDLRGGMPGSPQSGDLRGGMPGSPQSGDLRGGTPGSPQSGDLRGGSPPTAAPAAAPLIIYSPHGPEMLKDAKQRFEKLYPDAKVDWVYMGAAELFEKLEQERGAPKADILWGGPHYQFIRHQRLFRKFSPNWRDQIPESMRDADQYWHADLQTPLSIAVNKQLVKKTPNDWDDLLRAEYKGKIILRDPAASGTMITIFAALMDRQMQKGAAEKEALAWLGKLENQIGGYAPHSQSMFQKLGEGLFWLSLWNIPEIGTRASQGYPVDFLLPSSGVPLLLDAVALIKKPQPHKDAEKFINFVGSKELSSALADSPHFRIPTRSDLAAANRYTQNAAYKIMPVDWQRVAMKHDKWILEWVKKHRKASKLLSK